MATELEQSIEELDKVEYPQSPIVVVNSNHYCEGFVTIKEAQKQITRCQRLTEKRLGLYSGNGKCSVCTAEEVIKLFPSVANTRARMSHPFGGLDGMINREITVVVPLE